MAPMDDRAAALGRAHEHAVDWLASLADRAVPPQASVEEVVAKLGTGLPDDPSDPSEVIDLLAAACDAGLTAMPSGRFYGMVIGGSHPAALAADWLTSAWDQNAALRDLTPAHTAVEDVTSRWLLDLLRVPDTSAVGYATGATMANFTCLAAARGEVLRRHGWDVGQQGLTGGPRVRVIVGAERHESIDLGLRYLGLGAPEVVAADREGRLVPESLSAALDARPDDPTIVLLQAGNVHSGAFDPFTEAVELAHRHGAWVHVDGAFGLFAAASSAHRHLVAGFESADSWATDAHKTLNVPYDCGLAIVADPIALRTAMSMHGDYLIHSDAGDPFEHVPELSRRGRAFPVWAVLRSLGRTGIEELVDGFCRHAARFAEALSTIEGAEVVNDVVFTQVCASFGSDERTQEVVRRLLADGTAWMSGSRWRGRAVLRISVSNWSTSDDDVRRSIDALLRAAAS
jgi:glutamate/tyrosine decarboxylase-like PLP-dependent enzyme